MIIGGREDLVGAKGMELAELIMAHKQVAPKIRLNAVRTDQQVSIRLAPLSEIDGPFDVHLVQYAPTRKAHITRGENAGRDITYVNVVGDWQVLGQWDGQSAAEMQGGLKGDLPAVVLVQQPGPGAILAAAHAR